MKIVFFNRFFFPDSSATSQILSDLAFHLAKSLEVHVVTSRVPEGESPTEVVRGVTVHRVAAAITRPHNLLRRAIAYGEYCLGARRVLRKLVVPGDIVVVKTDPPMLSAAIGPAAKARGARLVVWLQDLFPEVALEYGVPGLAGPAGAWLHGRRNRSLSMADAVVAVSERMADRLSALGFVPSGRLHVIPNWADGNELTPVPPGLNEQRKRWGLEGRFVIGYSGNLGRVHEFDTLLSAASRLRDDRQIVFLIVGRGPRLRETKERVAREGLDNVRFEEHQHRDSLRLSLNVPDVHVSVLQPRFEGLVLPSKLYGIMAVGRPLIFVGDVDGETATVLNSCRAGLAVKTGDSEALAAAILRLRDNAAWREELGVNARRAFEAQFDISLALARWEALLERVGGYSRRP